MGVLGVVPVGIVVLGAGVEMEGTAGVVTEGTVVFGIVPEGGEVGANMLGSPL